jgi:hypothetical protein
MSNFYKFLINIINWSKGISKVNWLAHRIPLASRAQDSITGGYWYPVLSGRIHSMRWEQPLAHRILISPPRIGAQDTKIPAMSFPYRYIVLIARYQIGIW